MSKLVADTMYSPYVYYQDDDGLKYPIKRVAKPSSRYSNAKWLRSSSPIITKGFQPKIVIEPQIRGDLNYQVWDNTLCIPGDLTYSRILS